MSFFGFGGGVNVTVHLDPPTTSNQIKALDHLPSWKVRKNPFAHALKQTTTASIHPSTYESDRNTKIVYAYEDKEDVRGTVNIAISPGKQVDHLGIKVEFVGRVDRSTNAMSDGRTQNDFISLSKELSPPGVLYQSSNSFSFHFKNIEKPYESYNGRNISIRYLVRVLIERKFLPPIASEKEVIVQIIGHEPKTNDSIKMEVGIEDCLHIEFMYRKKCYHLKDVIVGKINFLLVKIKIKYMELAVIRRETSGENVPSLSAAASNNNSGSLNNLVETQTLTKHEIMDGAPVKGEIVPVKLFLAGIPADLTPTHDSAQNGRFSVRYFLNLVLVDEEDRRYFKQQEIILWRKDLG